MKNWQKVSKDELVEFIKSYPCELSSDYYIGFISWNDFRDGRVFPESMVAIIDITDKDEDCRICRDYI